MTSVSSALAATKLAELTQVLYTFFHALDQRQYERVLAHFTEDCRWLRQGRWLEGKAEVKARLVERASGVDTCHVMTNSHVTAIEGASVEVHSWMTAYRYPVATEPDGARPDIAGPLRVNSTTTVFRRDVGHDWRIAEQRLLPVFGFAE